MNFKRFHESKNLFDGALLSGFYKNASFDLDTSAGTVYKSIKVYLVAGTYTVSFEHNVNIVRQILDSIYSENIGSNIESYTFTTTTDTYFGISFRLSQSSSTSWDNSNIMLNTGSQPLPYEPYGNTWVDTPHYIHKTDTDTLTTLPDVIYANDNNATVGLKGNTVQNGTPTPSNPIQPQEAGDLTGNLFDYVSYFQTIQPWSETSAGDYFDYGILHLSPNTTYTFSTNFHTGISGSQQNVRDVPFIAVDSNTNPSTAIGGFGDDGSVTVTTLSDGIIRLFKRIQRGSPTTDLADLPTLSDFQNGKWVMCNDGSTTLPYEPYGYKIPILSGGVTTPVYLGEVRTTRNIKKLVLTGQEEGWTIGTASGHQRATITLPVQVGEDNNGYCTHYKFEYAVANGNVYIASNFNMLAIIDDTNAVDKTTFLAYLAAQYASGTPVCVWYVLANETTGIVNEPLRKIGDYADTVSSITIPTTAGANTLSIGTTVQPSKVNVNYKGWHPVSDVHVYPDSSWMPTSWEEFRKAVRSGKAQSLYPVGAKLYENWGDETSNAWIVVDYPNDNRYIDSDLAQQGYTNRVMLMEEKLNYLRVFDTKEAWLYVETAIPAGTYRFTIPNYDTSYGGNKTYIFTSTANVPVGGQLTLTWAYNTNPTNVQGYSSSTSTTALFDVNIAEWDGTTACIDLGIIKLAMADADSTYGKLNHIHRARYGSNNYYQSGLRQWLNADATANNWWSPSNIFDRPYDNRNTAGRLNTLNSNMKAVLATPTVNCITNNLFEYPSLDGTTFSLQTAYTVRDKLFLVTHTETNLSATPNIDSVLAYYTNAQNADRIKYRKDNGNAYYWWLRTPSPTTAHSVRFVSTSGALSGNLAFNTYGSAAACIIQ